MLLKDKLKFFSVRRGTDYIFLITVCLLITVCCCCKWITKTKQL